MCSFGNFCLYVFLPTMFRPARNSRAKFRPSEGRNAGVGIYKSGNVNVNALGLLSTTVVGAVYD